MSRLALDERGPFPTTLRIFHKALPLMVNWRSRNFRRSNPIDVFAAVESPMLCSSVDTILYAHFEPPFSSWKASTPVSRTGHNGEKLRRFGFAFRAENTPLLSLQVRPIHERRIV